MKITVAVHWQYGTSTHSGWYRGENEDRSLLRIGTSELGDPYAVAIIADGMGGLGSGAEASETALTIVKEWMDDELSGLFSQERPLDELELRLTQLFAHINARLQQDGAARDSKMGTTLTVLVLHKETFLIHHIGDCRVYYLKQGGPLKQLTEDQSWAAEQVRQGRLSAAQAAKHPNRHVLLQCLGVQETLHIYSKRGFYDPYSLFLLCSDGLYRRYKEEELRRFLTLMDGKNIELQDMSAALVEKALDRGADDNLTLMLIRPVTACSTEKERRKRAREQFYRQTLPDTGRKAMEQMKSWLNNLRK
ncbi:PP2C family protein-serine/threonine phosphatase [Paenibacillus hamazuiensis]|uniref:PP2C family protein-serine/threonine phosphatase n=1 Tax=Paenibacillus hamazuiensis TaxID=2936508 RepID=UPI00200C2619|nr:protein phosphatase 2C domain-containing protein [Paenibacillus hamazuiensis]